MCVFTYVVPYFPKIAKNTTTTLFVQKVDFFTHTRVLRSFGVCFGQTRKLLTPPFEGTTWTRKKKKEEKKKKNGDFTDDDDDAGQGGGNGGRRVVGVVVERWHLAAS